jgi:hypothetical protein
MQAPQNQINEETVEQMTRCIYDHEYQGTTDPTRLGMFAFQLIQHSIAVQVQIIYYQSIY